LVLAVQVEPLQKLEVLKVGTLFFPLLLLLEVAVAVHREHYQVPMRIQMEPMAALAVAVDGRLQGHLVALEVQVTLQ
jgi:hypothetical protein